MSIFASHVVTLVAEWPTAQTDADGNRVVVRGFTSTPLVCTVQPLTAAEAADLGQETQTLCRVMARSIPAGAFAHVVWDGREWDVDGEPKRHRGSPAVAHDSMVIRARAGKIGGP